MGREVSRAATVGAARIAATPLLGKKYDWREVLLTSFILGRLAGEGLRRSERCLVGEGLGRSEPCFPGV